VTLTTGRLLATARALAEDVLFPGARAVDTADRVPASHLELLATGGFYGPPRDTPFPEFCRVVETLASGCLTTAFVWLQHLGGLWAAADSSRPGVREHWYEPLSLGLRRGGVAQGALRPGPPAVRAERIEGGYRFTGESPWVTGWGMIDTLYTAARTDDDTVVWALLDAVAGETLSVQPLELVAVRASRTVSVRFAGHLVPEERVTGTLPYEVWRVRDAGGLRLNGSLALGVAARCLALLGRSALDPVLHECRDALDAGTPESLPDARAAASALATRAAAALVAATGAPAVLHGSHAERLTREALFLLVFGSRPSIKAALGKRLTA
jgi:alkylation response protein AidB-like acyl-CoA dehydrogenase